MNERILIVDDEEAIRLFLQRALEAEGYRAVAAENGAAALREMAVPPHLAIVDIRLPDVNGLDLVARIKRMAPQTEVILISGFATIETAIKAIEYGAFAYITKPPILKELYHTLARALEKQRLMAENARLLNELRQSNRQLEELNRTLEKRVRERTEELLRSQEELERRARELAGINEITNAVTRSLDFDEVLRIVAREMKKMIAFDRASISLTRGSDSVTKVYQLEPPGGESDEAAVPYPLAGTGIDWVVRNRNSLLRPSLGSGPSFREDAFIRASGIQSGIVVPLIYQNRVMGTLNLGSRRENVYGESHDRLLRPIAGQIAIALANADLYQQLKSYSENLEARVNERTEALASSLRELKEAQARLVQSEKLAALAKLVAGVAHEVKNPLSSMSFSTANIENVLTAAKDWEAARRVCGESLGILKSDISRLKNLVDRFIAFARPGQSRFEAGPVNPIVRDVVRSLGGEIAMKKVELEEDYAPELPPVLLEKDEFHQSVLNLLVNALEAVAPGGRIAVRTSLQDGAVRIEILDDGPGIPPEIKDRIFDVFFTTKPSGGGLGLSQVYRMAETHRGSVVCENRSPRRGTIFRLALPPAREERMEGVRR